LLGCGGGEQAAVERFGDGGGAVSDAELGVDVEQMRLDGGLADKQPGRTSTRPGPAGVVFSRRSTPFSR
jgi:hypothetical protein